MKEKIKKILPKSEFTKNVLTLLTGSGISQIIPVLSSLVLARLYSPEDFGVLALYISIVTILGSVSGMRYEIAIILPKREEEAKSLLFLSLIIAVATFILYAIIVVLFDDEIISIIKNKTGTANWNYVLPIGILVTVLYQVINLWTNRKKKYKKMAVSRIIQSSSSALINILLGFFHFGGLGLIIGSILGQLLSVIFLVKKYRNKFISFILNRKSEDVVSVAKKYNEFPIYSAPSTLFNSFSNVGLPILITFFYSPIIAGLYFFAYRTVRLPFDFMFSSFSQVYREHAVNLYYKDKGELLSFTKKIQLKLVLIMLPVLILISFSAPFLFKFLFGMKWYEAGEYVKYFAIFIFFNGIYSPVSSIGDVLMKQKAIFLFNIFLSIMQIGILYFMSNYFSFEIMILSLSLTCGMLYLVLDFYMKKTLKSRILND